MTIDVPRGILERLDSITPFKSDVTGLAETLFPGDTYVSHRAVAMYQILELLARDDRLTAQNITGDVVCLDVGSSPGESAVFKGLRSHSLVLCEDRQGIAEQVTKLPTTQVVLKSPINALACLPDSSADLITMFNAFSDDIRSFDARLLLAKELNRVLRKGGNFVLTADSTHRFYLRDFELEFGRGGLQQGLRYTHPEESSVDREPMWGVGWVMRDILAENVLGFDYEQLKADIDHRTYDANIMVLEKI